MTTSPVQPSCLAPIRVNKYKKLAQTAGCDGEGRKGLSTDYTDVPVRLHATAIVSGADPAQAFGHWKDRREAHQDFPKA
jgi:hypothetical protein